MRSLTRWRSSWAEVLSASGALALGAGMLAALNPCGFALLPAYLTLLVTRDQPSRAVAVTRALMMTAAMTAGYTAVFAVFGLVVAPVASSAQLYLPWFSLAAGLALAGVGLWLLAGRTIAVPRSRPCGQAPDHPLMGVDVRIRGLLRAGEPDVHDRPSIGAWGFALALLGSITAINLPRIGRRLLTRTQTRSDAAHDS